MTHSVYAVEKRSWHKNMLAAAVSTCLFVLPSGSRSESTRFAGTTIVVSNCDDAGPGSLREAIAMAANGDTVDLTQLTCSTITLATGALVVTVDSISLLGPNASSLTISADGGSRVLSHTGDGLLSISGMTIAHGKEISKIFSTGGCISSDGDISIVRSIIRDCRAESSAAGLPFSRSLGGGIYSKGKLSATETQILGNIVTSIGGQYSYAEGGGLYARGGLELHSSTISGNTASQASPALYAEGGGVKARLEVVIESSVIDNNDAYFAGGISISSDQSVIISNSTVSGNTSEFRTAGIAVGARSLSILNSTIAFNSATRTFSGAEAAGAGLLTTSLVESIDIRSSIISNNTAASNYDDFDMIPVRPITGSHNLVRVTQIPMPDGTLISDPLLAPLSDNGGPTRTHALLEHSPALDTGIADSSIEFDQRGLPYARLSGPEVDIGAFEYQRPDGLFADGFESALLTALAEPSS